MALLGKRSLSSLQCLGTIPNLVLLCTSDIWMVEYLIKILLVAGKKAITKNWVKTDIPNKQWMSMIADILAMEQLKDKLKVKKEKMADI